MGDVLCRKKVERCVPGETVHETEWGFSSLHHSLLRCTSEWVGCWSHSSRRRRGEVCQPNCFSAIIYQTDISVDLPNLRMPRILSTSEPTTSRTRIRGMMRSYPGMYALSAKGRTPLHPRIPRKSLCKEDIRKWDVSNARRTVTTGTMWGALQCTQTYTVFRTNVSSIFTVNSKFPFSTQRTHAGERIIGRIQRERMGISQLKCPR